MNICMRGWEQDCSSRSGLWITHIHLKVRTWPLFLQLHRFRDLSMLFLFSIVWREACVPTFKWIHDKRTAYNVATQSHYLSLFQMHSFVIWKGLWPFTFLFSCIENLSTVPYALQKFCLSSWNYDSLNSVLHLLSRLWKRPISMSSLEKCLQNI